MRMLKKVAVFVIFTGTLFSAFDRSVSVDRSNFKTCEQSSFCRRCRKIQPGRSSYELDVASVRTTSSEVMATIINADNGVKFKLQVTGLADNTFRFQMDEAEPLRQRHRVEHVLHTEPTTQAVEVTVTEQRVTVRCKDNTMVLTAAPFRIDVFSGEELLISGNQRGLLHFEHMRTKPQPRPEGEEGEVEDPGAWEENFKSHHDTKPHGPTAVAMDFTFPGVEQLYGIPEHAESLALKSTQKGDPYRLYNLDVFEYEMNNGMSLYAAVPFLVAHGMTKTAGVFWLNSAETWVDVSGVATKDNVVSSIVNFVSGATQRPQSEVHFMSESGIVDVFFMLGPRPINVFRQYTRLTGTAPLPPYYSLGYHQCRWNYVDMTDVQRVNEGFDLHDIPMDVMWLDIEHTDNKKYFTWDPHKFSSPKEMQNKLAVVGRKLVVIVDPHIKRDSGYFLHSDAESNGYYVKTKDGKDYEGWCWPGSSSYLDFFNPAVRQYYAGRFALDKYEGSMANLGFWNDMNEPSVFNGPEVTMPKDCVHHNGFEHRDVHNIYGFMQVMSTYGGLLNRAGDTDISLVERPFILTRSAFAGSQRFAAIWTGDNNAGWDHLAASLPMCLSLAISGISFCGADVGGFFNNPDDQLFTRWYQAGAFLPFFRGHSHIETRYREPWTFGEPTTQLVRAAIRKRYTMLPLWYTLFYQHNRTGDPVIRPLWAQYPQERPTFTIDNQLLVGDTLLVRPVTEPDVSQVAIYFPGNEIWYDIDTHLPIKHNGLLSIPVTIDKIPVYQRGGTILSSKYRVRRSSPLMQDDPFTLIVALDVNGTAEGRLYMDDGRTHSYHSRKDSYLYLSLRFAANQLTSQILNGRKHFATKSWLERVLVVGIPPGVSKAKALRSSNGEAYDLETSYDSSNQVLTVRKPELSMGEDWKITLL